MHHRINPATFRNMFEAFDILHGVNDARGTLWREYDLSARKRSADWHRQEAATKRLAELAAKLWREYDLSACERSADWYRQEEATKRLAELAAKLPR